MANAKTGPKSLTDMMQEINAHRRYMHSNMAVSDEGHYCFTAMLVLLSFDHEDCLQATYHDVRQPLVNYTVPMADFKAMVGIAEPEQNENKLPEEKAAEAAPAP